MLETLKTPTVLYWLYTVALVFQAVGVALVVRDFRRARKNDRHLQSNLHNITKAWNNIPAMAREMAHEGGEDTAAIFRPGYETAMRVNGLALIVDQIVGHNQASNEPKRWVSALGPVSLILGIAFGYAASMLAIA